MMVPATVASTARLVVAATLEVNQGIAGWDAAPAVPGEPPDELWSDAQSAALSAALGGAEAGAYTRFHFRST
jgi:hypothetical protein